MLLVDSVCMVCDLLFGWGFPARQAGLTRVVRWWNRGCSWSRRLEEDMEEEVEEEEVEDESKIWKKKETNNGLGWQTYTLPEIGAVCKCWRAVSSCGLIGGFGCCEYRQRYWWDICLDLVSMDRLTSSTSPILIELACSVVSLISVSYHLCSDLYCILFLSSGFSTKCKRHKKQEHKNTRYNIDTRQRWSTRQEIK